VASVQEPSVPAVRTLGHNELLCFP
jgi:hypothetical protein